MLLLQNHFTHSKTAHQDRLAVYTYHSLSNHHFCAWIICTVNSKPKYHSSVLYCKYLLYLSLSETRVVGQVVHEGAGHSQDMIKMQANVHPLESGLVAVELHPVPPALWYHHYQLSHNCND